MNKLVLMLVGTVAVLTTAGALFVAKDNHRATRVASPDIRASSILPPSQTSSTNQEAPIVTNKSVSSNSVSVTNNSSSTTTTSTNQSSSTSSVSITVSADQPSSQTLSFSRGTSVSLTIAVNGSSGIKFTSTNPSVSFGKIQSGSTATSNFIAQSSFIIQPSDPTSGAPKGDPITITIQP